MQFCQLWRDFWDKNCFITWFRCFGDILRWKNMWLGAGVNAIHLRRISCKSTKRSFLSWLRWIMRRYFDCHVADCCPNNCHLHPTHELNLGTTFKACLPFAASWKCEQRLIFLAKSALFDLAKKWSVLAKWKKNLSDSHCHAMKENNTCNWRHKNLHYPTGQMACISYILDKWNRLRVDPVRYEVIIIWRAVLLTLQQHANRVLWVVTGFFQSTWIKLYNYLKSSQGCFVFIIPIVHQLLLFLLPLDRLLGGCGPFNYFSGHLP